MEMSPKSKTETWAGRAGPIETTPEELAEVWMA